MTRGKKALREPEIGPITADEIDAVMDIERHSFRSPWSREVFVEELDRPWAHVDVLRMPGERTVVAFINYWLVKDEVHILNVATHPEERRRGHAQRLLTHAIAVGQANHCRYVTLEVRRSNLGAIKLYRRFGFRAVGIRPNYYAEDQEDAILMILELPDPA
jgi:ribosomal-protein-alanine N-acetyltransferase